MDNKVLGKGLSALISERAGNSPSTPNANVSTLKVADIQNNSLQPRQNYDESTLNDLVESIKEKGVLQPILVRKTASGYEVVAGERRLRAARILKLEEIPAVVKNVTDREALVIALVENIQREDLNAVEEAESFQKLIEEFKFTQDEIAKSVGKNRATISNTLRLLKLPAKILDAVRSGTISEGHARALLGVDDVALQLQVFNSIVSKNLSVRDAEKLARVTPATTEKYSNKSKKNHEITALEEELRQIFGSKVQVLHRNKKGKIIIDYYSLDDLDRILGIMKK